MKVTVIETRYQGKGIHTANVKRGKISRRYFLTPASWTRIALDISKKSKFVSELDKGLHYRYVF